MLGDDAQIGRGRYAFSIDAVDAHERGIGLCRYFTGGLARLPRSDDIAVAAQQIHAGWGDGFGDKNDTPAQAVAPSRLFFFSLRALSTTVSASRWSSPQKWT